MNYLLDTNVVSEMVSRQPNKKVLNWIGGLDEDCIYLNVITIGELRKAIEKLPVSARKEQLKSWLFNELFARFEYRILSVGVTEMLNWGAMVAKAESVGRTLSAMDSIIAAIAVANHCTLVTRNDSDFTGTGVIVVNPWNL